MIDSSNKVKHPVLQKQYRVFLFSYSQALKAAYEAQSAANAFRKSGKAAFTNAFLYASRMAAARARSTSGITAAVSICVAVNSSRAKIA